MSLTPREAVDQSEKLILDFCQEMPAEEQFDLEEKNLGLIKEMMDQVGHEEFTQALIDDVEPPTMFDVQFYARLGNKEVVGLLNEGLESDEFDDIEDSVVGLCALETDDGLNALRDCLKNKKFYSVEEVDVFELLDEILEEVSEEYKDKMIEVIEKFAK